MAVELNIHGKTHLVGRRPTDAEVGEPCEFEYKGECGETASPHFCIPRAELVVDLLGRMKSPETGEPFEPLKWQLNDIVYPLFGVVRWHNKHGWIRRYRTVWVTVCRKSGKTWIISALTAAMMRLLPPGSEMMMGAQSQKEAKAVVGAATMDFINNSPEWKQDITWRASDLLFKNNVTETTCKIGAVTKAESVRGGKYAWSVLDEVAFYHDPGKTVSVVENSWGNLAEPVMIMMTTLPWDVLSWGRSYNSSMEEVLADPDLAPDSLPVIYRLGDSDNWRDEEVWLKVSPALAEGVLDIDNYRAACDKAENNFEARRSFLGEMLNAPVSSEAVYIEGDVWDKQPLNVSRDEVFKQLTSLQHDVFAGADFADVSDFCSFALAANMGDYLWCWQLSWIPQRVVAKLDSLLNGKVSEWIEQKCLRIMPDGSGPEYVAREVLDILAEVPGLEVISFDKYRAEDAVRLWESFGVELKECRQGRALTPAIQGLKRHSENNMVVHGNDPVLSFAIKSATLEIASNTEQWQLTKPQRDLSARRIDPAIALCTALQGRFSNLQPRVQPKPIENIFVPIKW